MVLEAVIRIPEAPSAEYRRTVLSLAARESEETCLRCGADRFHLVDALFDRDCWENRGLAVTILRGCPICAAAVAEAIQEAKEVVEATPDEVCPEAYLEERRLQILAG